MTNLCESCVKACAGPGGCPIWPCETDHCVEYAEKTDPAVFEIISELGKRLDDLAEQTKAAADQRDWMRAYSLHRYSEGMASAQTIIMRVFRVGLYERKQR